MQRTRSLDHDVASMSKDDEQRGGFVHVGDFALDLVLATCPVHPHNKGFRLRAVSLC